VRPLLLTTQELVTEIPAKEKTRPVLPARCFASRMNLKDTKMLWGRSGNRCAICKCELIADPLIAADDPSIVGDMAHIVAREPGFTRGDYDGMSDEQRQAYANHILVCKIDHKKIDDQARYFTVDKLHEIKTAHERWVRERLSRDEMAKQREDELYAGYIQDFFDRIDIDHWTIHSSWICSDEPEVDVAYHKGLTEIGAWLISRLWPHRYPDLEEAFLNFRHVLSDLLSTFNNHAEFTPDRERLMTSRFYRSSRWLEQSEYRDRVRKYEAHTALVQDLFFELTRALNYICDLVRNNLMPGFRVREGTVIVGRGPVGFDMHVEHTRPEYRGDERTSRPYPGLEAFKTDRYSRDFYVNVDADW
jgi:hypothetical protein